MEPKKYQVIIDVEEGNDGLDLQIDGIEDDRTLDAVLWVALMGVRGIPEEKMGALKTIFEYSILKLNGKPRSTMPGNMMQ